MSALAMALHVLVTAASTSGLHLETPLALRLEAAPDLSAPPVAPSPEPPIAFEPERHLLGVRPGPWTAAVGATALGDAGLAGLLFLGVGAAIHDGLGGGSGGGGMALADAALIAFLIAPPAFAAWGAEKGGAPGDLWWRAFGYGTLTRVVGAGLGWALAAAAQKNTTIAPGPVFAATFAASELIVMPWVVARTLDAAPDLDAPESGVDASPSTRALPVHDPALAR